MRPPASPACGAHVDDVVSDLDDVRIVLDHDDRVALVAQLLQQLIEPMDVAWMEADARLVEDVGHVDKAAAEVLDHLDALRLAAGQRVGLAVQAQVIQPDVDDGLQPLDEGRDHGYGDVTLDALEDRDHLPDFHRRQLVDRVAVDLRGESGRAEAGALAQRAGAHPQVWLQGLLRPLGARLDVAPDVLLLELLDHAEIGRIHRLVADAQLVLAILAVEEELHLLGREVLQLLVVVEEAGCGVRVDLPPAPGRDLERALAE